MPISVKAYKHLHALAKGAICDAVTRTNNSKDRGKGGNRHWYKGLADAFSKSNFFFYALMWTHLT